MELVNFSVTNFRSITAAHKVSLSSKTVLIGKNNEGKSNLLKALDIGMNILLQVHSRFINTNRRMYISRREENQFNWERDFPIQLQDRKKGLQTIIRLEFLLNEPEILEFKTSIKSNLNGTLPIIIRLSRDSRPVIEVSKKGKGFKILNSKSPLIASFIARKITFNYIPAIRTDQEAMDVVKKLLSQKLRILEDQEEYIDALETIKNLQKPILDDLSNRIREPLKEFLPNIQNVKIESLESMRRIHIGRDFDIVIDDGTPTSILYKGDGVKSLAALSLLKDRGRSDGASIVAIEEPESHLHPEAIHQLHRVINSIAIENQVIITTHNPLFVERDDIHSNIIIDAGKASPAKNVKQIRDLLGIRASDNLTNANYVLVVEGESDEISLKALIAKLSPKLKKALDNRSLIIDTMGGAGNLSYKLSLLKGTLCNYHVLLDNDESGINAYNKAEQSSLLSTKNSTFTICNGSVEAEFEDCLNLNVYHQKINFEYGVDLNCSQFHSNSKWSKRVKEIFLSKGKQWNIETEKKIKLTVADCVRSQPLNALNEHKRSSIESLIESLEKMCA